MSKEQKERTVEVVRAGGETETHTVRGSHWFPQVAALIGCEWLEPVRGGELGRRVMLVDEEGLLTGKPFNAAASLLVGRHIVGDVAIVKGLGQ